jgi:hypothetical protein
MKLSDLKKLINNVNTMGFSDDEVEVQLNYTFSPLKINYVKSEVKAGEDVRPIVKIDFSA